MAFPRLRIAKKAVKAGREQELEHGASCSRRGGRRTGRARGR